MRKYSTERARANEFGGTTHTSPVNSTNDFGSNAFGSTMADSAFVKIRNSGATRIIEPCAENKARPGVISYGVSSYGYDMRVAPEFRIFTNALSAIVDPKAFDPKSFVEFTGDVCIVPPNSFALGRSVEYFRIPRNVLTICVGKSTYARCGIITNVTPFEPEWEGYVTLEISNTTPLPARSYANEGI